VGAWFLIGVIWGVAVVTWVSGLGGWVSFIQWLLADMGAQILIDVIQAGAAVTWVSSLNGDGLWASLPFPSTHATYGGMGTSHHSVMWVHSSSLMSFVVVLHDMGEQSQW